MAGLFSYKEPKQAKEPQQSSGKVMGLVQLIWNRGVDIVKTNLISFFIYVPFFYIASVVVFAIFQIDRSSTMSGLIYSIDDLKFADFLLRLIMGSVIVVIPVIVFGPLTAGTTYIYRCIVKGEGIFIWSDIWKHVKKFFLKGIIISFIDIVVMYVCGIAIQVYPQIVDGFLQALIMWVIFIFMVLFIIMHFYMYQLLIEYDLNIIKIYRYSFVFALLRLVPNLLILIVCAVITVIPFMIHILVGNTFILFFTIGVSGIIINYYTWPAIVKHFEPLISK